MKSPEEDQCVENTEGRSTEIWSPIILLFTDGGIW